MTQEQGGTTRGPSGAVPHFKAQPPDHSPPEMLADDELALSINTLERKLASARQMAGVARIARIAFRGLMLLVGFAILWVGPAPFLELISGQRVLATTWDVFAWWFAVLAMFSVLGALALQAERRRRRKAEGWQHRADDVERRLAHARRVQAERGQR